MLSFKQFFETDMGNQALYYNGWNDTVYGLLNWGQHPEGKTPIQWAQEMLRKLHVRSDYHRGVLNALQKYVKDQDIDYLGSTLPTYSADPKERRPSPFSAN